MASKQQQRCVFVGNIPYDVTEEQLIQICEEVGPVVSFRLVVDRETGKPKGYGFCEYNDEETALSARRNLQGYEINGRQLRVDFAQNDKGADRNRDQGRAVPGTSVHDPQREHASNQTNVGDSAAQQPIGLPLAMTSASVMAGALGGPQKGDTLCQNGVHNQAIVSHDPLTVYLSTMPRHQLAEVISEMKLLATQNKEIARQLLLLCPQLPKALFQAQIMLGMVTPQMMQMPNIHHSPSTNSESLQSGKAVQLPAIKTKSSGKSGALVTATTHLLPVDNTPTAPQKPIVTSSVSASQPPFLQQSTYTGHGVSGNNSQLSISNVDPSSSLLSRHQWSNPGFQMATSAYPVSLDTRTETAMYNHVGDGTFVHRSDRNVNIHPVSSDRNDSRDQVVHPAKLLKLDDGTRAPFSTSRAILPVVSAPSNAIRIESTVIKHCPDAGQSQNIEKQLPQLVKLDDGTCAPFSTSRAILPIVSAPSNAIGIESTVIMQCSEAGQSQNIEKQLPQVELPPEIDAALLEQLMNLTPEQLSSLAPEQQQQVIQLQQMLR